MAPMSTYLLIHGAWHGGWCYHKLVPLLEAEGHTVLAPDLPGHGDDKTPTVSVTLRSYANRICQIANEQPEPVILLGHSMGGVAITEAAEQCAEKIAALVYLSAFLPRNGDSLMAWSRQDPTSLVNSNIVPLEEGVVGMKPEAVRDAFYQHCSDEDAAYAQSRLVPQAIAPLVELVTTSASRWGQIPRYYIECGDDHALTLPLQRAMQRVSPCKQTFSINTDHSPFLSAPEELARILMEIRNA